jgi:cytochrome c-type biogenesis protein CcmF
LVASEKRESFMRWTILLSIICFSLSLLGTFLVRSGALTSVHAFAVDPARGIFILGLLALATGGALTLYALRAHTLKSTALEAPVSRESFILINSVFLSTACATVVTGTLYPLLLDAVGGGTISVGAPYFNTTVLPLMAPVAFLMIIGPMLKWQEDRLRSLIPQLQKVFILVVAGTVAALYVGGFKSILGLVILALGLWVVIGTVSDGHKNKGHLKTHLPRLLAHAGFGLTIIGVAGSSFSHEYQFLMQPHQVMQAGDYRLELASVDPVMGTNYQADRGTFYITHGSSNLTMQPEQRFYPVQAMALSNVAIHTTLLQDLYLAMGEEQDNGDGTKSRTVRFHINPLVPLIWIGGATMALGGMVRALTRKQ